ncbi:toll/interleukin-1 receptor domain-containing protein [Micromonospora sp. WMMA1923]|uniref:toll/interleukin-1 receptor domain-containing protein n=1 Tax=Micromonospora sp. WMMA1923 TaxID=3404125 RepID=UPI003B956C10
MIAPGKRIDLIRECATLLDGRDWEEIDLILTSFDFPISEEAPAGKRSYAINMLQIGPADKLPELHGYLTGSAHGPAPEEVPWRPQQLRAFASHVSNYRDYVSSVGKVLELFGIHMFVAHDSITPSKEWEAVIQEALKTCDVFVCFLSEGYNSSPWCNQEIGWAMSRRVPILPLNFGINPPGFLSRLQAQSCIGVGEPETATRISNWLTGTPSSHTAWADGLVRAFETSGSYARTRSLLVKLEALQNYTPDQLTRLEKATKENDQIYHAIYDGESVSTRITRLLAERGRTANNNIPTTRFPEEPPF